ncbi:MAG: Hsp20/alpha crystallin family protein [Actinomycetota bacterium]|jgi:HSP20 family protein|nr:Hsp20/alpha crystallin family protein [Actinomycetota bacterium]
MLMRFDPFREVDRMADQALASLRSRSGLMAIDAFRRDGDVHLLIDLPGVDPASIDLVVEKNVLSITAERRTAYGDDDEVVVAERPAGPFTRQLFLGEGLDADRVAARYEDGVLAVVIPVAEQARPRRVTIATPHRATAVEAGSGVTQSTASGSSPVGAVA